MSHDHTFIAGEILTAANQNDLISGTVAYVTATSNQTGISTLADVTSLTATFTAIASRRYLLMAQFLAIQQTSTGVASLSITNGANTQQTSTAYTYAASSFVTFVAWVIVAPGAGSATYKVRASTSAGTLDIQAGAAQPSTFAVIDIGST